MKYLNKRLNALYKIGPISSFKTRKMIGNGIFMSKLIYLMPLWGGCEKYLIDSLQKIQNKAARVITRRNKYTRIETILNQIGWLSVKQLIMYHSLVLVYKTLSQKYPVYLYKILSSEPPTYRTRFIAQSNLRRLRENMNTSHVISQNSFRWRASSQWNELPVNIKTSLSIAIFKTNVKMWIKKNVPL